MRGSSEFLSATTRKPNQLKEIRAAGDLAQQEPYESLRSTEHWKKAFGGQAKFMRCYTATYRILECVSDPPGGFVTNRRASRAPTVAIRGPRPG